MTWAKIPLRRHLRFRRSPNIFFRLLGASVAGGLSALVFDIFLDLPEIEELRVVTPGLPTIILDQNGSIIDRLYSERRDPVPLKALPRQLTDAIIAAEDSRFLDHIGLDMKGILRSLVNNLRSGHVVQGGSTITQQLAKVLFLTPKRTISRKAKEAVLSIKIERAFTKDQILELYLNQIYFGHGAFGVSEASKTFFGKPVDQLTLPECALIAALPRAPYVYSPFRNPRKALTRRNWILSRMREADKISQEDETSARTSELLLRNDSAQTTPIAPYFVDFIRPQIEKIVGQHRAYTGGLKVSTSLNLALQLAANAAIKNGLQKIRSSLSLPQRQYLQGALIAMDPENGAILAMVGGDDYTLTPFNRTISALRQPGSAFKPVVFLSALLSGYRQMQAVWDAPVSYQGSPEKGNWRPENYNRAHTGRITLRQALAQSNNIASVRLLENLGISQVIELARRLGWTTPLTNDLSLAFGTSEISPLELTTIYAIFANGGFRVEGHGIKTVRDASGASIYDYRPHKIGVVSPDATYILTDMLRDVVKTGTAHLLSDVSGDIAGKTGTTSHGRDAWFIGYTPQLVMGVWVGIDHGSPKIRMTGGSSALPIWKEVYQTAEIGRPYSEFSLPNNVTRIAVDPFSGLMASDECRDTITIAVRKSELPIEPCRANTPILE